MGHHHALGPCRRPARVVDRQQITLVDLGTVRPAGFSLEQTLVVEPALVRPFQRDVVLDRGARPADRLDRLEKIGVRADDLGAAVLEDVLDFLRMQTEVDRHEHGADLRHGVVGRELGAGVQGDIGDTVALPDPQPLQRDRPAVAPGEELLVVQTGRAVNDAVALRIERPGATLELERGERRLHDASRKGSAGINRCWFAALAGQR